MLWTDFTEHFEEVLIGIARELDGVKADPGQVV